LGKGERVPLTVHENDKPFTLAREFCLANNLTEDKIAMLTELIQTNRQRIVSQKLAGAVSTTQSQSSTSKTRLSVNERLYREGTNRVRVKIKLKLVIIVI